MKHLTILHDTGCAFCRRCVEWLKAQPKYLELEFLAVDSPLVEHRYPGLKAGLLQKELTVVDDEGGVYYGENAYVICLYALRRYREWSVRLSNPKARPFVRKALHAVTETGIRYRSCFRSCGLQAPARTRKDHEHGDDQSRTDEANDTRDGDAAFPEGRLRGRDDAGDSKKARLSPGATYYYFPSKEHIIQHYYEETYREQLASAQEALTTEKTLEGRLAGVVRAQMKAAAPYHPIARVLFKTAADPMHPISPFSAESKPVRDEHIELFVELVKHSSTSLAGVPKKLRDRLPELLWFYKMGLTLYWIHDRSPEQEKTFRLIDISAGLIATVVTASKIPGIKTLVNKAVEMFDEFKQYE